MNSGERGELLTKLYLVYMRDNNKKLNGTQINSVWFDVEYGTIPPNISSDFSLLDDDVLIDLTNSMNIKKGGQFDKSDVYINGIGYSLKSQSDAPPALINHTTRPKFERVCKIVGVNILELDKLIDKYWDLRFQGVIAEDVKNSDPNCPFKDSKRVLKPILKYFLFKGSGTRDSKHPADYILEYSQPCDPSTWKILNPSIAVDLLWDKLVFSLRAKKGMPKDYDKKTYAKPDAASIARWTRYHSGNYRGAFHVRVGK